MNKWLLLGILLVCGCTGSVVQLEGVEVNDYEGMDLSSINDFRENSIRGPQYVDINNYELKITGLVDEPVNLSYDEVLANQHYSKVVTLHCVEGWSVMILWEGVLFNDLIKDLGVSPDANTVIFKAYDGYTTSHPLDYLLDSDVIIAYKMNNVTMPPERGYPFQLVAQDKWGYKWIKWITEIELSDDPDYEGYWESRGYNNDGSLSGSRFS